MKKINKKSCINILYDAHVDNVINRKNKDYLYLLEHFNDLIANIDDNNLRNNILYSYVKIENLLFNYISYTSKNFYELGFNDLKNILFSDSKITNIN